MTMHFDEETHSYTRKNKKYTSVTTILKKYGLSANYGGIPQTVLDNAATRGKAVHKGLELFLKGDQNIINLVDEVSLFNQYAQLQGIDLTKAKSESIYYDDNYLVAGTVDIQYVQNGSSIIADFKTTSSIHFDSVSWQLSIYNYLICNGDIMLYYMNKLKVLHFTSNQLKVRDIELKPYNAIENLLTANLNNVSYTYVPDANIITTSEETLLTQLLTTLDEVENTKTKLTEELKPLLENIKTKMVDNNTYTVRNDKFILSYVFPYVRKTLDKSKVEPILNQNNVTIDSCMKETTVDSSVRYKLIKPKGGN